MDGAGARLAGLGGTLSMATVASKSAVWRRWALSVLVGGLCLWFSLRGLDLTALGAALLRARGGWLAAALGAVLLVALLKAARWHLLYPPAARLVNWRKIFPTLMIAQMLNVVIPLRVGELARIGLMAQDGVSAGATLSTIVVEKSLDLLTVGALVGAFAPLTLLPEWLPATAGLNMALTGAGILGMLLLAWRYRAALKTLAVRLVEFRGWLPARWRERLVRLLNDMLEGLGALHTWRNALPVLLFTTLSWVTSVATMVCMLAAFDFPARWQTALVLSLAIYLSNLVPLPPGLVGVVSAVTVVTLGWFGLPRLETAALGVALNVVLVGPLVLLGGAAVWLRFARFTEGAFKERWAWSLGLRRRT